MTELSRRQLLAALGVSAALGGGVASVDENVVADVPELEDAFEQFYRRPTKAGLPDPEVRPAVGVTDQGLFEFRKGGDGWTAIPLGTTDHPIPEGNFRSLGAESLSVEPVKIGLLADPHYPGDAPGLGAVGIKRTTRKLKQFVAEMNEWGPDRVFFMGDMMPAWGDRRQSRAKIRELRHLLEDDLSVPTHMMWGNHEYQRAAEWGTKWSYEPWGISKHSETWYAVDVSVAKILVLNNGYSEEDHVRTKFLPEQIEWLRRELRTTRKPVVVLSHLPLSAGTGQEYDRAENEEKVGRLLSRYDNVVCCIFGHCHHDSSSPPSEKNQPAFFDQMREQRRYGLRHFFVPWIHRLRWDADYTPYGKLYLYPDGNLRLEAPYAGTGTRETFVVNGRARTPQFAEDEFLRPARKRLRWQTHFDSISGFGTETTDGGSVELGERGAKLTVDDSGGEAVLRKLRGFDAASEPITAGWTNCVWRCYVHPRAVQNATVELLWGDPETNYVGYRIDGGEVRGVRQGGDGEVRTHKGASLGDGEPTLFQLFYSRELDRVNFLVGPRGARPKLGLSPGSPSRKGSDHALTAGIRSDSGREQSLVVGFAAIDKGPDLAIRQ